MASLGIGVGGGDAVADGSAIVDVEVAVGSSGVAAGVTISRSGSREVQDNDVSTIKRHTSPANVLDNMAHLIWSVTTSSAREGLLQKSKIMAL
jgi:hypothetical protein